MITDWVQASSNPDPVWVTEPGNLGGYWMDPTSGQVLNYPPAPSWAQVFQHIPGFLAEGGTYQVEIGPGLQDIGITQISPTPAVTTPAVTATPASMSKTALWVLAGLALFLLLRS